MKCYHYCIYSFEHIVQAQNCNILRYPVSDFQNYLRTQTGNNTTVNIIISTVDYLLRVQVSSFCSPLLVRHLYTQEAFQKTKMIKSVKLKICT